MNLDDHIAQTSQTSFKIWFYFMILVSIVGGILFPLWFILLIMPIGVVSFFVFQVAGAWWLANRLTDERFQRDIVEEENIDISSAVELGDPIGVIDGCTIYDFVDVTHEDEKLRFQFYSKAPNETDLPTVEGLQFCHVDGVLYSRNPEEQPD